MTTDQAISVQGPNGTVGTIDATDWATRHASDRVYLTLVNGQRVLLRSDLLQERNGGAYLALDVDAHTHAQPHAHSPVHAATPATAAASTTARPATAPATAATSTSSAAASASTPPVHVGPHMAVVTSPTGVSTVPAGVGDRLLMPIVEEQAVLNKRVVRRKVRVRKTAHVREEMVGPPLMQKTVDVQRVPINEVIQTPAQIRQEGDTLIVPVMEEVLVVEKRLMLREEVRLTTRRTETREQTPVQLRYEQVDIEREPGPAGEAHARGAAHTRIETHTRVETHARAEDHAR
ncbi:MAG TPA: DUF2382 domain-containing protein [Tepidisphaeraceae bacterium]|jgi:uncharacterized protein (TIGR02271 family)